MGQDAREPLARALFVPLALQNFMMSYNSTAMNVALSEIIRDLDTTLTAVQATISLYALVIAAFVIAGSKLGARHGHWRTFLLGAEVFALGALLVALARHMALMMIGWSLLQGIGVALMLPSMLALLTGALSGANRTKALTAIGTIGGIGAAAGPLLGGVITHYLSWRVSFLLGSAVSVAVVLLLRRAGDPEAGQERPRRPFDVPGAALSALGCGLLVVSTLLAGRYGMFEARHDFGVFGHTAFPKGGLSPVPVLAVLGLALLAVFALWELRLVRRERDPLVRVSVLRNRTVRMGAATQAMQYLIPSGALFLVPVFVQTTLGFNALHCGLTLIPTTLGLVTAAPVAAKLVASGRMSHRTSQIWSFLFMFAGCAAIVAAFDPYQRGVFTTGLAFAPGLFLFGLGEGMSTTMTDLIQSAPPSHEVSDVTGLSRSVNYLGSSLGIALAGAFLTVILVSSAENDIRRSTVLTPDQKRFVTQTIEGQVQVTAASDAVLREKLKARGITGAEAAELVRINARSRERALTVAVSAIASLCALGYLLARRLPPEQTKRNNVTNSGVLTSLCGGTRSTRHRWRFPRSTSRPPGRPCRPARCC